MLLADMWQIGLTPEMAKIAEVELGETAEIKTQALKDLRRLINAEEDFRPLRDDAFLLRFLRCKKYNVQKAFHILKNHYTFKVRYAGLITDFKPSQIRRILEMNIMFPLHKRLADGSSVAVLRIGHFDINNFCPEDLFAACLVCVELGLETEATQVCGSHIIFDYDKFGLRQVKNFASPTFLYRVVRLIQDCLPVRMKGFHMVNEPLLFSLMFSVIKPILNEKIKSRIHFHGHSLKSLHKIMPPDILPAELGGTLGPIDSSDFQSMVLSREAHFERLIKHGYQEKKAQFIRKKSSKAFNLFM